eukprot:1149467-Pelagomonas_calceolata.AAC.8
MQSLCQEGQRMKSASMWCMCEQEGAKGANEVCQHVGHTGVRKHWGEIHLSKACIPPIGNLQQGARMVRRGPACGACVRVSSTGRNTPQQSTHPTH